MNDVISQIAAVLSEQSFFEEYGDLEKQEDIIAAIQTKVPEATAEEIDACLTSISTVLQREQDELDESDLDDVAGGIVITLAVIGTACKCVALAATVGGLAGGAIWYWKNRKN